jgi:hypothetical protein
MGAKYQIRTVVNKEIKEQIAEMCKVTGRSESMTTKELLQIALNLSPEERICAFYKMPMYGTVKLHTFKNTKESQLAFKNKIDAIMLNDESVSNDGIGKSDFKNAVHEAAKNI